MARFCGDNDCTALTMEDACPECPVDVKSLKSWNPLLIGLAAGGLAVVALASGFWGVDWYVATLAALAVLLIGMIVVRVPSWSAGTGGPSLLNELPADKRLMVLRNLNWQYQKGYEDGRKEGYPKGFRDGFTDASTARGGPSGRALPASESDHGRPDTGRPGRRGRAPEGDRA